MGAWDFAKKVGRYIPGVAQVEAGLEGDYLGAVNPFQNVVNAGEDAYGGAKDAVNAVGDKLRKPYEDKAMGIASIQERLDALKKERMARMDQVYGKADAKFDNSRAALKQLYGDPSGWKL